MKTHLNNTLNLIPDDYMIYVIGDKVEKFNFLHKNVFFLNVPIKRNFSLFFDFYSFIKLSILIIKYKPVIIHSLMMKSGILSSISGKILRVKCRIHTFTGQVWQNEPLIKRSFLKFIDSVINNLNTICLTDSQSQSIFLY